MQTASYVLAAVLALVGLLFLVAAGQGNVLPRVIISIVLLGAAAVLVWLGRVKSPGQTIIQNIDLPGNTAQEQIKCKACGGTIGPKDVSVEAGAVFVKCPYCGTSYQLEEAPKW
jgi:hypothetical protein